MGNTFDDCLSFMGDVMDYADTFHSLEVVRRRVEEDRLGACVSMLKAMDTYRDNHDRFEFIQEFIDRSERSYLNGLLKPLSKKLGWSPLYIASRDGDAASDFHSACDNQGPTVVIVNTTLGRAFGPYTKVSWASDGRQRDDFDSFLFRLRPSFKKYVVKKTSDVKVYHHAHLCPIVGNGHDLFIKTNALSNYDSYTNSGYAYDVPTDARHELNDGERNFKVSDYVVLKAVPL